MNIAPKAKNIFIPKSILACTNERLRDDAIAAYTRGTDLERNAAAYACMEYEAGIREGSALEERKRNFAHWLAYLESNPVHNSG